MSKLDRNFLTLAVSFLMEHEERAREAVAHARASLGFAPDAADDERLVSMMRREAADDRERVNRDMRERRSSRT